MHLKIIWRCVQINKKASVSCRMTPGSRFDNNVSSDSGSFDKVAAVFGPSLSLIEGMLSAAAFAASIYVEAHFPVEQTLLFQQT
jgi:hypothetical protein